MALLQSNRGIFNDLINESHPRMRLELVKKLLGRSVLFHPDFVRITNSVTASLMLSQALYWGRTWATKPEQLCADGWFCKSAKEWQDETGLSRREQETARRILRDIGFLDEKKQGMPAKSYYRLNLDRIAESVHPVSNIDWMDDAVMTVKRGRPISFYRSLVDYTGSATASLMLSYAIGLTARVLSKRPDGWFCKPINKWQDETGLSRHEQETARRILRGVGFMEERRACTNQTAMLFRVDLNRLESPFAHRLADLAELKENPCIRICDDDCDDDLLEASFGTPRVITRALIPGLDDAVLAADKSIFEALSAGPKLTARSLAEDQPVQQTKKKTAKRRAVQPSFDHPWVKETRDGVHRHKEKRNEKKGESNANPINV